MEFLLYLFIPFVLWTTATKWRYIFYFACCWNWWPFGLWNSATKWVNFLLCLLLELLMAFLIFCLFVCPCVCAPVCMSRVRVWDWLCWQAILILTSHFGFFGTYWQTQLILLGDLSKRTSLTFICHGCGCVSSHSCVHANVKYKIMAPFVGMKIINKRKNN